MRERRLRRKILETARELAERGLNRGTSGNLSARWGEGFLITPSGLPYDQMTLEDLVAMGFDGSWEGHREPSTEWRMHRDILRGRPEAGAVIHTHSTFATTLACLGREVPAFHYMIAVAGGNSIRCAPYATFGTQELSDHALRALAGRKACLLANHGMVAVGTDLEEALDLTLQVESLCEEYWRALQVGSPNLLPDAEMERVLQKFRGYGRRRSLQPTSEPP